MKPDFAPWARTTRYALLAATLIAATGVRAAAGVPGSGSDVDPTELSLTDLLNVEVYSASKYAQKASEAPSDVVVVTAADIKAFGYRKLSDILDAMPGLYTYSDRNYDYVGIRGFARPGDYMSRLLLLVDGNRMNDSVYSAASIGTEFPIDVDLIERVEFVPGPGSSIYGSNAFFGVVNVITRRGRDANGLEASVESGNPENYKARLTYGGLRDGGAEWLLSATSYRDPGRDFHLPGYGVARGLDYDRFDNAFAKFALGGLTIEAAFGSRKKGIPTSAYGCPFGNPDCYTVDTQGFLDVRYERALDSKRDLSVHAGYNYSPYDGSYPYLGNGGQTVLNVDGSRPEWWNTEARVVDRSLADHKLVYGAEYHKDVRAMHINYDVAPYQSYDDSNRRVDNYGLYVQDEWSVRRNLILNVGLRHDTYTSFGSITDPRLGIIYSPDAATNVKLLYGQAFRAPNVYELGNGGANQALGSADLKPERVKFYEAILERSIGRDLRASVSGFQYKIADLIDQVLDPATGNVQFENTLGTRAYGTQLGLDKSWTGGASLRLSWTYLVTRNVTTNEELTNSPHVVAKAHLRFPIVSPDLHAGIETLYVSSRDTTASRTGGYAVTNLTLLHTALHRNLELSASVYNLFDKNYYAPATPDLSAQGIDTIPQELRTFRVKLTYRL